MQVRIVYSGDDQKIDVFSNGEDHLHEEKVDIASKKYFIWTSKQTEIVQTCVKLRAIPKVIRRELIRQNAFIDGKEPTADQLNNKIAYEKRKLGACEDVFTSQELRRIAELHTAIPEDENEGYVADYFVDDDEDIEEVRFGIIVTTKYLQRNRLVDEGLLQVDATYRINWQGFPLFAFGSSSSTGSFFGSGAILGSHEDHKAWEFLFQFVKKQNVEPKINLSDGDNAITKGLKSLFSNTKRTMCWAHVYKNTKKKLASVKAHNEKVAKAIESDIKDLQWSAIDEETFETAYHLLVQKWKNKNFDASMKNLIIWFFDDYFTPQWIETDLKFWFEGANPFHIGNNQGLEGKNNDIKKSHTFRRRLRIPALFECLLNMVHEWSKEKDDKLFANRNDVIELKDKDAGYEWKKINDKPGKILTLDPRKQFTVMENPQNIIRGTVKKLWIVPSSETKKENLKVIAKEALKQRNVKNFNTFDEYIKCRKSCYILEEVELFNGDIDFSVTVGLG